MTTTTTTRYGLLPVLSLAAVVAGCTWPFDSTYQEVPPPEPQPARPASVAQPPHVTNVDLPEWPPLGRDASFEVQVEDETSLAALRASFRENVLYPVRGKAATVRVQARLLGEGLGTLSLTVMDGQGARAERLVQNLLVDLTPPTVELERDVVSSLARGLDGDVALLVKDAFVLGEVELSFRGTTLKHAFPHAYPSTLGKAWDVSRVAFPAKDLPEGSGTAVIIARDAAGNSVTRQLALRIDGTAPAARIVAPAPNETVQGRFDVAASAIDGTGEPGELDVYVGGSKVATLLGPDARLTLDATTMPKGPLVIDVVARDDAGNASEPASITVQVR